MTTSALVAGAAWRQYGPPTLSPILASAVRTFVRHGYHGTTTRTLASEAGLSVAGLYHHFASKQAILEMIMQRAMQELWTRSLGAAAEAGDDAHRRLAFHIECLVLFHAHRRQLALLAATEMRSLEPTARAEHVAARDRQERLLADIIVDGVERRTFTAERPMDAARALITMCTGVSQWFSDAGPSTAQQIADQYVVLAERALLAHPRAP